MFDFTAEDTHPVVVISNNYYGGPGWLPSISFHRVVSDRSEDQPKWSDFKNKVVFVGVKPVSKFMGQRKDEYPSPFPALAGDHGKFMSGLEVQATIFLNLLRGDWLRRFPRAAEEIILVLTVICFSLLLSFGFTQFGRLKTVLVAIPGAIILVVLAYYTAWRANLWLPWLILIAFQLPVTLVISLIFQAIQRYQSLIE